MLKRYRIDFTEYYKWPGKGTYWVVYGKLGKRDRIITQGDSLLEACANLSGALLCLIASYNKHTDNDSEVDH